ncbi:MAG: hypothetical protein NVS2B12_11710 [Ktedonobacteraceae bacterium]
MQTVADWGTAIYTSLAGALALFFAFIPKLLGFLVILLIGWLVATAVEKALTLILRKVGFDRIADRIGLTRLEQQMGVQMDAAGILGRLAYWFVFLIFLVPAVNALGLTSVSDLIGRIVGYLPNVFVAILVLFLGTLAASFVADLVRGAAASARIGNPNVFAAIARYAIMGFVALIALEQLQIAPALIQILFTAIVGSAALAFGLAFGLGGREAAQRLLSRGESGLTTAAAQAQVAQQMASTRQEYSDAPTTRVRDPRTAQ